MQSNKLLRVGVIGTMIAALCCFTPILVILFATIGLSWAVGYLDYLLLPAMVVFMVLIMVALWRRQRSVAYAPSIRIEEANVDDGSEEKSHGEH